MRVSYAVPVCNELTEVSRLLDQLIEQKHTDDEIVVLLDKPKASKELEVYLEQLAHSKHIVLVRDYFDGHFAEWKNKLNSFCTGDFIMQIDADEHLPQGFIDLMHTILEANPEVDLYYVPRINTVDGLTEEHILKWGWRVQNGRVNYPDYQTRLYRNTPYITWRNKVHEVVEGYKQFTVLPGVDELSILHPKTIERQEKQNSYYSTL